MPQHRGMKTERGKVGHRALRKGRVSIPGQIYFVTIVCRNREKRFLRSDAAIAVARKLREPDLWGDAYLLCWVLMPDHAHFLIRLGAVQSLSTTMRRAKSITANAVNAAEACRGSVWMPAFHDHALRAAVDVTETARYIIANPIRAGLVMDIRVYPYWGTAWSETDGPII